MLFGLLFFLAFLAVAVAVFGFLLSNAIAVIATVAVVAILWKVIVTIGENWDRIFGPPQS